MHSYVGFLLNVTFNTYNCTYSSIFRILHKFSVFRRPSWILAAILNCLYGQNGTKYYLSCLLDIKCSPLRILSLIQEIQLIFLVLAAILDFGGHLELPKDARLASIRF